MSQDPCTDAATVAVRPFAPAKPSVAQRWLFDNPKTIVIECSGPDTIRFHSLRLSTTTALHVQLKLCAPRKPQEAGKHSARSGMDTNDA